MAALQAAARHPPKAVVRGLQHLALRKPQGVMMVMTAK
jgi:hypothetical protein